MSTLGDLSIADRYRAVADAFGARVRGTTDWDAPTPVAEWRARDVVRHLVTWFPGMLEGGSGIRLDLGDADVDALVDRDPAEAWERFDRAVTTLLADPARAGATHRNEHTGEQRVDAMTDRFLTGDVFFHTWDLARATGQDDRLDAEYVAEAYDGMTQMADVIRGSGQFGEQQPVPEDASTQEKLMAFLGRDPRWTPPASG